jgi:hypothetical protein
LKVGIGASLRSFNNSKVKDIDIFDAKTRLRADNPITLELGTGTIIISHLLLLFYATQNAGLEPLVTRATQHLPL